MAEAQGSLFGEQGQGRTGKGWRRHSGVDVAEIVRRYNAGESAPSIAKSLGVSYRLVYDRLREVGAHVRSSSEAKRGRPIVGRRRCALNEAAFDVVTDEAAYWIGFLMADGSIHINKVGQPTIKLTLARRDEAHLCAFREFLSSTHKISHTSPDKAGYAGGDGQVQFAVASTRLVEALARFGVGPRKSLSAKVIDLDGNPHFWRGAVDGDGWVGIVEGRPIISLCGSHDMTSQFAAFVRERSPGCIAQIQPRSAIWSFTTTGRHAVDVLRALYSSPVVSLSRKRTEADAALCWKPKIHTWAGITLEQLAAAKIQMGTWRAVERSLEMPKGVLRSVRRRLQGLPKTGR